MRDELIHAMAVFPAERSFVAEAVSDLAHQRVQPAAAMGNTAGSSHQTPLALAREVNGSYDTGLR